MTDRADTLRQQLIRNFNDVPLKHETREPLYEWSGSRLAAGTVALKLGASVDTVPPGKRACPYHFHYAQEEMFIVLEGEGTLRVAGEMLPIRAGDVMFIPPGPAYPHQIINTSAAPLKYLSVSTKDSPEVVEYPDSGKYLASATRDGDPYGFDQIHPLKDALDYWDGEP
ncbi:MAG: cupin domain-containing protein [Rhizobacter sp.]|nr:cupin domain-containing protein [Rhizobacter sp.]